MAPRYWKSATRSPKRAGFVVGCCRLQRCASCRIDGPKGIVDQSNGSAPTTVSAGGEEGEGKEETGLRSIAIPPVAEPS